jgi:hypothetical protein
MEKTTIKHSPWGEVQSEDVFKHGIAFVSTASHGGFMVPIHVANVYMSADSLKLANSYCKPWAGDGWSHKYYAFEEDCAGLAVVRDFPELSSGDMTEEEIEEMFRRSCAYAL